MTPQEFQDWRKAMNLTQEAAAEALDLSRATIKMYEAGKRPGKDARPVAIPRTVALACAALACGLEESDAVPQDWPEIDFSVDHTSHRALQASILDNLHKPDAVRSLVERWFESERELLQALLDDDKRLSMHQMVLLHRAVGA
ncbi:MAG: helix-turn-helix transcriptional regulator [Pseudomonadota bacterium]